MGSIIPYYFAYVSRRPRSPEDLPAQMKHQIAVVKRFAEKEGHTIGKQFMAILTNRDRHFAETGEFREAARLAREGGCALVVADLFELLSKTHPDRVAEALTAAFDQGVALVDAKAGGSPRPGDLTEMAKQAVAIGRIKRQSIGLGLALSSADRGVRRPTSANNQPKAAQGAQHRAQVRANRLRPEVEEIQSQSPTGTVLTAVLLADELNKRSILTDNGNAWSRTTAGRLLKRLGYQERGVLNPARARPTRSDQQW